MLREIFIVKNTTIDDVELKDFGIIIPPDEEVDLNEYDRSVLSDELFDLLSVGTLVRIIEGKEVTDTEDFFVRPIFAEEGFGIIISGTTISVDSSILTGVTITKHGDLTGLEDDDHLQYLRTDGTRNLTGILSYDFAPTFASDNQIVSKLYVDNGLSLKLNITDFNTFTGTTLPDNYYNKSEVDGIESGLQSDINNRLLITDFNTYSGNTLTTLNGKQNTITGAATTIVDDDLAENRALISNGNGKVAVSNTTSTQIGYLANTTSDIQGQLNLKAPLESPNFTGTPTAPTAAVNTNTTQIATTAYVVGQSSTVNPLMNGTVAIGTSLRYSREDHVHPSDTSKVNIAGDTMTGNLTIQDSCFAVLDGTDTLFRACSIDNIVYVKSNGLTGIVEQDDLSFYADGKVAFGDSTTVGRLRGNTPGSIPRTLSLIDTNAVVRVWRFTDAANADPAVEFVWGVGDTPTSEGNAWWDMYLDGAESPDDAFAIRRRTDGDVEKLRLTTNTAIIPMTTSSTSTTTGALVVSGGAGIAQNLNIGGTANIPTLTVGTGLAKYLADYSASYDARTMVDKNYVDTLPLTTLGATSAGSTSTTSTTYVLQTGMQITNVPIGTYLVGYGNWLSHGSSNAEITTQIYVGGTAQTGSEMLWSRGGNQGNTNGLITYSNFVITLATTQTVEIRWRTNTGTATSNNRYLTLLKVSSIR